MGFPLTPKWMVDKGKFMKSRIDALFHYSRIDALWVPREFQTNLPWTQHVYWRYVETNFAKFELGHHCGTREIPCVRAIHNLGWLMVLYGIPGIILTNIWWFPESYGYPHIMHFGGIFPYKPSSLGYPHGHGHLHIKNIIIPGGLSLSWLTANFRQNSLPLVLESQVWIPGVGPLRCIFLVLKSLIDVIELHGLQTKMQKDHAYATFYSKSTFWFILLSTFRQNWSQ